MTTAMSVKTLKPKKMQNNLISVEYFFQIVLIYLTAHMKLSKNFPDKF